MVVDLSEDSDTPFSLAGGGDWDDSGFLAIRGFAAAEAEVFFFAAAGILTRIIGTIRKNKKEVEKIRRTEQK